MLRGLEKRRGKCIISKRDYFEGDKINIFREKLKMLFFLNPPRIELFSCLLTVENVVIRHFLEHYVRSRVIHLTSVILNSKINQKA